MNIEEIKNAKTNKLGKQIEFYKELESTHLYAKSIAKNEENEGKVILADKQTAGIGTKGRKWFTGDGKNIAMTIILHPNVEISKLDGLTIKIAKIIQQVILNQYGYSLEIKEPNDLVLKGKKICGILTEVHTRAEKICYLLISFGFNVNEDNFSNDTKNIATSLKKEFNKDFKREEIIIKILENIEEQLNI